jgi:hypothetical protein
MSDWDYNEFLQGFQSRTATSLDAHIAGDDASFQDTTQGFSVDQSLSMDSLLQGRDLGGDYFNQMQRITESGRLAHALKLPVNSGTRVSFVTNTGSLLTYPDPPVAGMQGTVIKVRTAHGDATYQEDRVFVLWDDGKSRAIHREHLQRAKKSQKRSSAVRMMFSNLGDISYFFASSDGEGELVHKATRDLWSYEKNGDGFVLERLFTEDGGPLKV